MKGNPADLGKLAEDLDHVIQAHPDALDNNKDIADGLVQVRNKARERYEKVTERPRQVPATIVIHYVP